MDSIEVEIAIGGCNRGFALVGSSVVGTAMIVASVTEL
jgi:hypothetical protein